jgi:hypothetical protein
MLPSTLRRQLNRLRRRERALGVAWCAARCLALCVVLLFIACFTDWLLDRGRDTPWGVRLSLLLVQIVAWPLAFFALVVALARRFSDDELALWVEARHPELRHRLISAVQLQRPGARTAGMSAELIAAATVQAEKQARNLDFPAVADHRRLRRAVLLLLPVVLVAGAVFLAFPATMQALMNRLFLGAAEIPRQVSLANASTAVWPAGEPGVLRFRVEGAQPGMQGEVGLSPESGPATRHELIPDPEGESGVYIARVPTADVNFTFLAWLGDGRLRTPGHIRYEPRPVVQRIEAVVQLPVSLGLRPDGTAFEEIQKGGDIVHRLPNSRARVVVGIQKPVVAGRIELLGPLSQPAATSQEPVHRTIDLKTAGDGSTLEGGFDVRPDEIAYRIVVRDEFGFENIEQPRRTIRTAPLDPPEVVLLPELAGDSGPVEDREIEGIPVLLGERFRFDYKASCRYGLSHARMRYRVVSRASRKEGDSGAVEEEEFRTLPIGPSPGAVNITDKAKSEFSTMPAADPRVLGGLEGGGRYDFNIRGIPDGKGGLLDLKEGDRIQFFVEVFSRADPEGRPGRSLVREKEVVGFQEFQAWLLKKEDLKERTRELEERQRNQKRP